MHAGAGKWTFLSFTELYNHTVNIRLLTPSCFHKSKFQVQVVGQFSSEMFGESLSKEHTSILNGGSLLTVPYVSSYSAYSNSMTVEN